MDCGWESRLSKLHPSTPVRSPAPPRTPSPAFPRGSLAAGAAGQRAPRTEGGQERCQEQSTEASPVEAQRSGPCPQGLVGQQGSPGHLCHLSSPGLHLRAAPRLLVPRTVPSPFPTPGHTWLLFPRRPAGSPPSERTVMLCHLGKLPACPSLPAGRPAEGHGGHRRHSPYSSGLRGGSSQYSDLTFKD